MLKLLESKRRLFEDMERIRLEQKELLDKSRFDEFYARSENVDAIIDRIKNIDYDIARLESDDLNLAGMMNSGDTEIKKTMYGIVRLSKRNNDLTGELIETLKKSSSRLKEELGDTVEMSKIGGYKTAVQPSPAYFDKTS